MPQSMQPSGSTTWVRCPVAKYLIVSVGQTAGAEEINGAISQAMGALESVNAALEQVKQVLIEKSAYHQQ